MKKFLAIILIIIFSVMLGKIIFSRHEPTEKKITFLAMDTVIILTACGEESDAVLTEAKSRVSELDDMMDAHREGSDLWKLKNAAGREKVAVHREIFELLELAKKYNGLTEGKFDASAGALAQLWKRGQESGRVPTAEEIAAACALKGFDKIILDRADLSAYLTEAGLSLDFGGLAKGYALDEIRRIYLAHGGTTGLINVGTSSVCACGSRDYRVGIRKPNRDGANEIIGVVTLNDAFLSTSGDYERGFEAGGVWYHHLIDPLTGFPADNGLSSVTVIIPAEVEEAGVLTDLLSTAAFILGREKGEALINKIPGAKAIFVGKDGEITDRYNLLNDDRVKTAVP